MAHAVQRHSGYSLRMDVDLLAQLLYGDEANQATQDELLVRIKHTTVGQYWLLIKLLAESLTKSGRARSLTDSSIFVGFRPGFEHVGLTGRQ